MTQPTYLVSISYNMFVDIFYAAILATVLSLLVLTCVMCERMPSGRSKTYARAVLYTALALVFYLCIYALPVSVMRCGVELSNDKVVVRYVGCGLELIGENCILMFTVDEVVNVTLVDWRHENTCKPTSRTFGLSISGYLSGWFGTTCGKALILSNSPVNIVITLRNRDYKIILGPAKLEDVQLLLRILNTTC